jgi:hypothetical protein
MRHALIRAIGIGALIASAPALAVDNPACAKFDDPLAYNACLARFGPRAPETHGVPAPETHSVPAPDGGAGPMRTGGFRRMRGGLACSRERRTRARAEFDVGPRPGGGNE